MFRSKFVNITEHQLKSCFKLVTTLTLNIPVNPKIVPGNSSYVEVVCSTEKTIVFGDCIPRGIRLSKFNSYINRGYVKIKSFPGTTNDIEGIISFYRIETKRWIF